MMKTKYIGLLLCAASLLHIPVFAQTPADSVATEQSGLYTLDECLNEATRNNIKLRNAENGIAISAEQRKEALTKFFPTVEAMGCGFVTDKGLLQVNVMGLGFSFAKDGVAAGISALQPIFAGGQIINGNKLAAVGEEAAKLQRCLTENEIRLATEQYYWQIVMLKEKLVTLDTLDRQLANLVKDVQAAVDAGVRNRNDLLQVQLRRNEFKTTRIQVENAVFSLRDLLAQAMGHPLGTVDISYVRPVGADNKTLAAPGSPQDLFRAPESAVGQTYEYQLLDKQVEASKLTYKMAVGKKLPTVALGAGYVYGSMMDQTHTNLFGMVTVTVPISAWWSSTHDIKRKKIQAMNAVNDKQDKTEMLTIRIRKAWNDLNDAYKQVGIAAESVTASEENLRLNTDYYKFGTSTIGDMLDAQTLYQQSLDKYVEAFANYELKKREYLQSTGR